MNNIAVKKFVDTHYDFFDGDLLTRGLYIRFDTSELFVIERKAWKDKRDTFVFEFNCGCFVSCRTEINTMEKYILEIHKSDYAEYITF